MTDSLEATDLRSAFHPWTSIADHASRGPIVIESATGARVRDSHGREYVDGLAGLWCVDIGYGRQEVADAIAAQASKLPYYHSFFSMANAPTIELADRLKKMCSWPVARVFFGLSGSDANDTQFKLVWLFNWLRGKPEKRKIISRHHGYHGSTVAAASATGLPAAHDIFGLPLPGFLHVRAPYPYREMKPGQSEAEFVADLADELDATIEAEGPETVGAFIAEPVMGAGGVIVPPAGYFPAIQEVLRRHDVLLIADEVITGFGRLGRTWGCEALDIEPDLVSIAKGLTSGYAPLSGVLVGERVWDVLEQDAAAMGTFGHGYTYSGHPVSTAAALANLDVLEREGLFERAAKLGALMQRRMHEIFDDHPHVGDVRGMGFVGGIEFVRDRDTREPYPADDPMGVQVYRRMIEKGVLARAAGNVIAFCPAYVISENDLETVLLTAREALDELT